MLEKINIQEGETLLYSSATDLVISLDLARKQEFKLKKIGKPIYMRNIDSIFNKKGLIELQQR